MLPRRLYHYTDFAGLTGIIENHAIWATEIGQLNDSTEIAYSREMLARLADDLSVDSATEYALYLVRQAATAMASIPTAPRMFVASLTDDGDNLSQWRGYASQGRGFALGFDRDNLESGSLAQGFTMVPVIYDEFEQEQHFTKALSEAVEIIDRWGADPANAPGAVEQLVLLGLGLTFAAMFIKNPYFRDEREWRLVRLIMQGVWDEQSHTRIRNGKPVEYEEIDIANGDSSPIVEIVIGPLSPGSLESELRQLLDGYGLDGVTIRRSSVPLRNS
jgi:hypothetical protein